MEINYSFQVHSFQLLGTTCCQNLPGHIIISATASSVLQRITQQEQTNGKTDPVFLEMVSEGKKDEERNGGISQEEAQLLLSSLVLS